MFTPISVDATETEQLKSILNEIEILKKLSLKSDYVINYLDSFSIELFNFNIYHIVTDIYEVTFFYHYKQIIMIIYKQVLIPFEGWHFGRCNRRSTSNK